MDNRKVKVTIEGRDGAVWRELQGDLALCLTIGDIKECLEAETKKSLRLESGFVGCDVPDTLLDIAVTHLLANFLLEKHKGKPTVAAEHMRSIGRMLNKKGMELYIEAETGKPIDEMMASCKADSEKAKKKARKVFLGVLPPGAFN